MYLQMMNKLQYLIELQQRHIILQNSVCTYLWRHAILNICKPTLLVNCLHQIWPLNHKRTASSLVPTIFNVSKIWTLKDRRFFVTHLPPLSRFLCILQRFQKIRQILYTFVYFEGTKIFVSFYTHKPRVDFINKFERLFPKTGWEAFWRTNWLNNEQHLAKSVTI